MVKLRIYLGRSSWAWKGFICFIVALLGFLLVKSEINIVGNALMYSGFFCGAYCVIQSYVTNVKILKERRGKGGKK